MQLLEETGNGAARCVTCGMLFSTVDDEDVLHNHPIVCNKTRRLQAKYGVQLYADREADKSHGQDLLRSLVLEERVRGAELILKAWFDRYVLNHDDEPSFEQYVAGYNVEREFGWAPGVVEELRRKHGKAEIRWP